MTAIDRRRAPKSTPDWLLGLAVGIGLITLYSVFQYLRDRDRFQFAMQSYEKADCITTVRELGQITGSLRFLDIGNFVPRAREKTAECEKYQAAIEAESKENYESALVAYADVAGVYEQSPLVSRIASRINNVFNRYEPYIVTSGDVCDCLDTLEQKSLLPWAKDNVAKLFSVCGNFYQNSQRYELATGFYQKFLQKYPKHSLTENVTRSLASSMVADLRAKGTQEIEPPKYNGVTFKKTTVVEIQNSSPAKMSIVFSGETPRFGEIEACQNCQTYSVAPPQECPGKGYVGRYVLKPGRYEIAAKFDSQGGTTIQPWSGTWDLQSLSQYKSCFYVVTSEIF